MSSQQFAQLSHLTTESRARALAEMSSGTELDVLVIGGGITGAGIALDAATRGLRTGIVERPETGCGHQRLVLKTYSRWPTLPL